MAHPGGGGARGGASTLNPEPETRNPKLETRTPKTESRKPETLNPKYKTLHQVLALQTMLAAANKKKDEAVQDLQDTRDRLERELREATKAYKEADAQVPYTHFFCLFRYVPVYSDIFSID